MRIPKYYEVKSQVLDLIADLPAGAAVPTERELAQRYATSRTTVRQAIADLVIEGRLERAQGRGTFVADPPLMQIRQLTSFTLDTRDEGRQAGSIVLDISESVAGDDVARHLEIGPGSPMVRVERLRTAGAERTAHEVAHLPGPLDGLPDRLGDGDSLYRTLSEVYGIELAGVQDYIETRLADPREAELLGVDPGLPLLVIHRTGWDATGKVVEWTRSLFRGDRYHFVAGERPERPGRRAAAG